MSSPIKDDFLDENGYYKEKHEDYKAVMDKVLSLWQSFLSAQDLNSFKLNRDFYIHRRNLYEVIKRLDKRRTYYYVFHKIKKTCEYKEIGILCYWINTLKPFMVVNENSSIYSAPNEMFSLYLILSCVAGVYEHTYPEKEFKVPDELTIKDYVYNFKYCDMSREATIFFVETLAKSYGIGMETNPVRFLRNKKEAQ